MKRSIARWSTALATATLLGLPATGLAQTPAAGQSPSKAASEQVNAPDENLGKARAALDSIDSAAVTGRAKTQIADLKRHLTALEHEATATSTTAGTRGSKTASAAGASWATDVAAMDKIIGGLVGDDSAAAVGTSGTKPAPKAAAAVTIDDATRGKLMDVRRAITAYAASKSGTASSSEPAASAATPDPAAAAASSSTASSSTSSTTTTEPPSSAQPPATASQPPAATSAAPAVDQDAARKALVEARDTLSQLTQLPGAAQLSGETRTQVSQLINNFNELISSQSDWRASYTKVQANMTALLGPEGSVDEPARTPPPTATSGAVGTSGSAAAMDPAVKAKLIELRTKLNAFEKAAGGAAAAPASATPAADPASATPPASSTSASSASSSSTPPSSATPATPPASSPASSSSTTPPPSSASAEQQKPAAARSEQAGHDEALRHIQAIEALLNGTSPTATSGTNPPSATATSSAAPLTLTAAQLTELRTHLAELKKLVSQADKK